MRTVMDGAVQPAKKVASLAVFLLAVLFLVPEVLADFQVQPISMTLSAREKSGVFSVINNGSDKIDFQVSAKVWSQDENGKDVYADTEDIIFFPKVMTVEPNSQRAIRIGMKTPPSAREKTYRLFVQEIPTPRKAADVEVQKKVRAGVTIAFRFALPIFIRPLKPQESYEIERVEVAGSAVKAMVKNTGNVHVKLRSVTFSGKDADGKEIFSKEIAGWYVLNGLSNPYIADIPKGICGQLARVDVNAQSEKSNISGTLNVQKSMCTER